MRRRDDKMATWKMMGWWDGETVGSGEQHDERSEWQRESKRCLQTLKNVSI